MKTRTIRNPDARSARSRGRRRATALIFAVGVLAVVALLAVAYITFVRLDRQGADAVRRAVNYEQQVNAVINHIGELLAADLYGGAVVTRDVPRFTGSSTDTPRWPPLITTPDYPYTHYLSLTPNSPVREININQQLNLLGGLRFPADKAFLAPAEPVWNGTQPFWSQFTNLRGAWRFDDQGEPTADSSHIFVRDDGFYADLSQFFRNPINIGGIQRANPGIDFSDPNFAIRADESAGDFARAPVVPMNFLSNPTSPTAESDVIRNFDERFFIDTTGDLIPDARWQVLDVLGDLYGLRWFVAARVTDASARINYNSSIESGLAFDLSTADGRTPADIDLYRLLRDAQAPTGSTLGGYPFNNLNTSHVTNAFRNHLDTILGLPTFFQPGQFNAQQWPAQRLTRAQRTRFWTDHGSSPFDSGAPSASVYPINELVDLMAFSGANNEAILTLSQQIFDGPENAGLLPAGDGSASSYGPLYAAQRSTDALRLSTNINNARPSRNAIRFSPRQFMTPVSGVSQLSPVPVLNFKAEFQGLANPRPFLNAAPLQKLPLNYSRDQIPEAFAAFVWALAPFATDEYLTHMLLNSSTQPLLRAQNATGQLGLFYGHDPSAGINASRSIRFGDPTGSFSEDASAASYAIIKAASLAVNTHDARQGDAAPTALRLIPNTSGDWAFSTATSGGRIVLGLSLPHGNVLGGLINNQLLGNSAVNTANYHAALRQGNETQWLNSGTGGAGNAGLTVVGLTRNPYIVEVFTAAVYSNVNEETLDLVGTGNQIDPENIQNQVGSMVAVQLVNPYPEDIRLDGYQFRLIRNIENIASADPASSLAFNFSDQSVVPANSVATFAYVIDSKNGELVGNIVNGFFVPPLYEPSNPPDPAEGPSNLLDMINLETDGVAVRPLILDNAFDSLAGELIVFRQFAAGTAGDPIALLLRTNVTGLSLADDYSPLPELPLGAVVDRFAIRPSAVDTDGRIAPGTLAFPFVPASITLDAGVLEDRTEEFFLDPSGTPERWYDPNFSLVSDRINSGGVAGRYLVTSSATRASVRPGSGGMSSYILDFDIPGGPDQLPVSARITGFAHGWLHPIQPPTVLPFYPGDPEFIRDNNGLPYRDLILSGSDSPSVVNGNLSDSDFGPAHALTGLDDKPANGLLTANIPAWQLFVEDESQPNGRALRYLADLHMVSKHAHLCRNNQLTDLREWSTVGQQLAASIARDFPVNPYNGTQPNPYMATLDPSRFVPIRTGPQLPDQSMAIPLALRVFECFEPLTPLSNLVQGRININTAPERVLHMLPMVFPDPTTPPLQLTPTRERAALMLRYRDRHNPLNDSFNPGDRPAQVITGLNSNLRQGNNIEFFNTDGEVNNRPLGFASIGELAILHRDWNPQTGVPSPGQTGFLDVALDAAIPKNNPVFSPWGERTASNPDNDPEKRLALFRALSNIIATRSDVFIATFVIRGYDPDIIESIEVTGDIENDMNSDDFRPTYESRWIVVYDRSNVRSPVDRPRILLKAQLAPPAR